VDYETPRALSVNEITDLIASYRHAAAQAKAAGFDGVEIHAPMGICWISFSKMAAITGSTLWWTVADRTALSSKS